MGQVSRVAIRVTDNFTRNLEEVEIFLKEQGAAEVCGALLDRLFSEILPDLERFPQMGADFFRREICSVEARCRVDSLQESMGKGTQLRELVCGEYLILCGLQKKELFLLSIKHHRQLSFDLPKYLNE